MKHTYIISILVILLSSVCRAQFKSGDVELSLMGSAGSLTQESGYSSSGYGFSNHSNTYNYLSISSLCGIYIFDEFSIEPEVGMLAIENSSPAQFIIGNLAYTYCVPNSKIAVFVRGGYGVSNAFILPMNGNLPLRYSDKFDIGIINAGGGVKYLVSDHTVLRIEINYRKQSYSQQYSSLYFSSTQYENSYSNYGVLVGFSILL
jgi:hypothetical protein